jgi:hypothetical protein
MLPLKQSSADGLHPAEGPHPASNRKPRRGGPPDNPRRPPELALWRPRAEGVRLGLDLAIQAERWGPLRQPASQ